MDMGVGSRTSASDYEDFERRRTLKKVVVVVDVWKELTKDALSFVIANILEAGDQLTVLGIMDRIPNPMGFKNAPDIKQFHGTNEKVLCRQMAVIMDTYTKMLRSFSDLCDSKGVFLDIVIRAGSPFKLVTLQQAIDLQATWIVLDRHLKKDRKFYMEKLPCSVLLMNEKGEAIYLRDCTGPRSTTERFKKYLYDSFLQDIRPTVDFTYNPSPLEAEEGLSDASLQSVLLDGDRIIDEIDASKTTESETASTGSSHFSPAVVSTVSADEIQMQQPLENGVKKPSGEKISSFSSLMTPSFVLLFLVSLVVYFSQRLWFLLCSC